MNHLYYQTTDPMRQALPVHAEPCEVFMAEARSRYLVMVQRGTEVRTESFLTQYAAETYYELMLSIAEGD